MNDLTQVVLCNCFRVDGRGIGAQIEEATFNWEEFFAEASEEAVLPALHGRLRELDLQKVLPASVLDFLGEVEALNGERNAAILAEVELAVKLLDEAGIQPILLKGLAYLATGVYSAPAARYMSDVDLLIPEGQIDQAAQVLLQNGFEVAENDPFARFRHHHPPLSRPGAIHFELHHTLTMDKAHVLLPAAEMIQSSIVVDLDGLPVRVPSAEHMMTHLILHSQIQHPYNERIWTPIRAMYDLVLLQNRFRNEIDWGHIEQRFRAIGHYHTFALHLLRVQDSLGFSLPLRIQLSPRLRVKWQRRQILRRFPILRYLDPVYMFSILIGRRLRMLGSILQASHGLRSLRDELLKTHIYKRFYEDVVKGRGH